MKKIYVEMVADLFHYGHVEFLRNARALGDYLTVGVLSDEWAIAHKTKPIMTAAERAQVIEACRYVDEVIVQQKPASGHWLREHGYINAIAFKGDADRLRHANTIKHYERDREVELPYQQSISTTDIIARVETREKPATTDPETIREAFASRWHVGEWLLAQHMLTELGGFLRKHRIPSFIAFGSLIGAMRHQGAIPWDDDIDIAITARDEQKLWSLKPELNKLGLGIVQINKQREKGPETYYKIWVLSRPSTFFKSYSWPFIDIFVLRDAGEGMSHLENRPFPTSYIFPLKPAKFGDLTVPVPHQSHELLSHLYSPDYMDVCHSTNFIHRHDQTCSKVVSPTSAVRAAGCFLPLHLSARQLYNSTIIAIDGWVLNETGPFPRLEQAKRSITLSPAMAALWKAIDGKRTLKELLPLFPGPSVPALNTLLVGLSALNGAAIHVRVPAKPV